MSLMRYLEVPRLARVLVCQLRPYSSNGREQLPPLDFSDTKKAYQSKSFRDVLRQYVVFKALSIESLATRSLEVCVFVCMYVCNVMCMLCVVCVCVCMLVCVCVCVCVYVRTTNQSKFPLFPGV